MADIETLGILDEIQALVSDKLQVVSYKWLSRNFSVPSNTAKRLLQEFVEKNGSGVEVVYSLSGWLRNNPSVYHIRLVFGPKLSEAKKEFNDDCSVQVYSVQACIPKDPAVLWNAEFVQAEELFKEPPTIINCLRDNRFCGVSNSFVKRNAEGTPISSTAPPLKAAAVVGPSKSNSANQTSNRSHGQERKVDQSTLKVNPKVPDQGQDIQSARHQREVFEKGDQSVALKEQVPQLPGNQKKSLNGKSSGTAGSLASMWGRASAKPKPNSASVATDHTIPVSSDAQVCAHEAIEDGGSDDDDQQMNFKRGSNGESSGRKRRIVYDFSDEDDDGKNTVSLASPEPPKKRISLESKQISTTSGLENKNLNFDERGEDKVVIKEEKASDSDPKPLSKEESNGRKIENPCPNKNRCSSPEDDEKKKGKSGDAAPSLSKKKKVLKTRIDERGREVTEVVWEADEKETRLDDNTAKKGDSNNGNNNVNRPPAVAKKSAPVGNAAGKTGNKKAGNKDPKQGNILSFFKKV